MCGHVQESWAKPRRGSGRIRGGSSRQRLANNEKARRPNGLRALAQAVGSRPPCCSQFLQVSSGSAKICGHSCRVLLTAPGWLPGQERLFQLQLRALPKGARRVQSDTTMPYLLPGSGLRFAGLLASCVCLFHRLPYPFGVLLPSCHTWCPRCSGKAVANFTSHYSGPTIGFGRLTHRP